MNCLNSHVLLIVLQGPAYIAIGHLSLSLLLSNSYYVCGMYVKIHENVNKFPNVKEKYI